MKPVDCRHCGAKVSAVKTIKGGRIYLEPDPRPNGNVVLDPSGVAFVYRNTAGIAPRMTGLSRYVIHACE